MATYIVGGEVDAFCTRCKLPTPLAHTIIAMVGPKIARVRCNTCGGDHAYRSPPGTTDRPVSRTSRVSAKPEKVIISFEDQLSGKDVANAPKYSPKDTYQVDQVIQHPTFGLGLVTGVRGDKVDITFKSEAKTLVHGRGGIPTDRPAFSPPSSRVAGPADKPVSPLTTEAPLSAPALAASAPADD